MFHFDYIYYFIEDFNRKEILNLDKKIIIIYRNYKKNTQEKLIRDIKNFCKINHKKFYLAGNVKLASKLKLDGVYIPSFNKDLKIKYFRDKNLDIVGSAHNFKEIKIKEKQGVTKIFLSPIFRTKKKKEYLDLMKFNLLSNYTNKKVIALGGINISNLKKLNLINCHGFAAISFFKKINDKRN